MSGSLYVPISPPVDMRRALPAVRTALADILGLPEVPSLVLLRWVRGQDRPLRGDALVAPRYRNVAVAVQGLEEAGTAAVDALPSREGRPSPYAFCYASKSPLGNALAAALALGIARDTGSVVVDEYAEWIEPRGEDDYDHSPEEFLEAVRVRGQLPDLLSAAQAFQDAMPAWQPIPDDEDEDQPEVSPGAKPRAGAG